MNLSIIINCKYILTTLTAVTLQVCQRWLAFAICRCSQPCRWIGGRLENLSHVQRSMREQTLQTLLMQTVGHCRRWLDLVSHVLRSGPWLCGWLPWRSLWITGRPRRSWSSNQLLQCNLCVLAGIDQWLLSPKVSIGLHCISLALWLVLIGICCRCHTGLCSLLLPTETPLDAYMAGVELVQQVISHSCGDDEAILECKFISKRKVVVDADGDILLNWRPASSYGCLELTQYRICFCSGLHLELGLFGNW